MRMTINLDRLHSWAEIGAACAAMVALPFILLEVWLIYQNVRSATETLDRPALLFAQDAKIALVPTDDDSRVVYTMTVNNQGSGNAYNVQWRQADEIPPLYSPARSKEETFGSYRMCGEAFTSKIPQIVGNMVIGAGHSQTMTIVGNKLHYIPGSTYRIKKYFAAFYESEKGKVNVSVIGLSASIDASGRIGVGVEEEIIVRDLRGRSYRTGRPIVPSRPEL